MRQIVPYKELGTFVATGFRSRIPHGNDIIVSSRFPLARKADDETKHPQKGNTMNSHVSEQDEIQGKARIRVRSISDIGIVFYILYAAVLLFTLVILTDCRVSGDQLAAEIHFCGFSLIDIYFDSNLISSLAYHKTALAWITVAYILLGTLPGLLFLAFKRFYQYRVEVSREWLFVSAMTPNGRLSKMTRISIDQLDSVIVKNELLLNGDTLVFHSRQNTIRVHCVTNAYDFARLATHYHARKTGRHGILRDKRHADHDAHAHHETHETHEHTET
jgi:hypothetical protein